MAETVTVRLDAKTRRLLRELVRINKTTQTDVIKDALHRAWKASGEEERPSAREVYARLYPLLPPPGPGPKRDRARNSSRLLKEILLAKRRAGTL